MLSKPLLLILIPLACAAQSATVTYSSFLGGADFDEVRAVARGPDGSIYVAGRTSSKDFPVRNAWQSSCALGSLGGCSDGFLSRFTADGRELIFSTYYGTAGNDQVRALAVDKEGNAVIAGNLNDVQFAFVARFSPNGQRIGEARVQGSPIVQAHALAIHPDGDIYVTGETAGLSIVLPASGYQTAVGPVSCQAIGGSFPLRAYVLRYTSSLALIGGTYFGGSGNSSAKAVATGPDGNVWIAGDTSSADLPLVRPLQSEYRGGHSTSPGSCSGGDAFFARFSADLSSLSFSSYHGGTGQDTAYAVAVSPAGVPVFAGQTSSWDLPQAYPTQKLFGGWSDGFLLKLQPETLAPTLSTYYGGSGMDGISAIRIGAQGDVYLAGSSSSVNLPLAQPVQPSPGGCPPPQPYCADAFVARWTESAGIDFATFFGGSGDDGALALDITQQGSLLVGGSTAASDFPTADAIQPAKGSSLTYDGMFFLISPPPLSSVQMVSAASDSIKTVASNSLAAIIGSGFVEQPAASPYYGFAFHPEGLDIEVMVPGEPAIHAPILFVSPGRIVFWVTLPPALAPGSFAVHIYRQGALIHSGTLALANPSPSLFSASGDGSGAAAAVSADANSQPPYEPAFHCGTTPASCITAPISASAEGAPRVLLLYGSGFTAANAQVFAAIGMVKVQVLSVKPSGTPGTDVITLALPAALAGQGQLPIQVSTSGAFANTVQVQFK